MSPRATWLAGCGFGATAVAAGAFGAHGLAAVLDARGLELWRTATSYQLGHALALLALGALAQTPSRPTRLAATLWTFGVIVFAGTLYGLALGGPRWLGAITPLGGSSLIAGWVAAALAWPADRAARGQA